MSDTPRRPDEERVEPWLERALDDASVAPPRAAFRDSLRAKFLDEASAAPQAQSSPSASNVDESAQASGEARMRSTAHDEHAPRADEASRDATPPRRRALRLLIGFTAVAAAAALAVMLFAPKRGLRVELLDTEASALRIDGTWQSDAAQVRELVRAGAMLESGDASARLRLGDALVLELAPHTSLVLAELDLSERGESVLDLAGGGVRVLTSEPFAPRRLRVLAPDAEIAIVGTEFGVDVLAGAGTCVCCTRGKLDVTPRGRTTPDRVVEGGMSFCFTSGDDPMLGPAKPDHVAPIVALRRYW